jgi:hypothetical protein
MGTNDRRTELGNTGAVALCGGLHPLIVRHAPIWGNTPAWPLTGSESDRRFPDASRFWQHRSSIEMTYEPKKNEP